MRFVQASLLLAVTATPALAQREPEIVIPGRPDVPVIINGVDASWGVLEGDFGLSRPGQVNPVVVSRPLYVTMPVGVPRYFPSSDRPPGYGRLEINPPTRRLPQRPPTINKTWSSQSPNVPVTTYPTYPENYMPFNISPMLMMGQPGSTSNGGSGNTPNAPNVWQRGNGALRRP